MKWISFDDMEPPIGMNIIITRHEDINIVKWGSHNPDSSKGTVRVCDDEFCSLIMDWKLHYWAPVSFFKEHLPLVKTTKNDDPAEGNNEYTCSNCKQTYTKGQTDQEALQEHSNLFPEQCHDELTVVCDPCFIKIMEFMKSGQKRYAPFVDDKDPNA